MRHPLTTIVLLTAWLMIGAAGQILDRITFKESVKFLGTSSGVLHMERDLYKRDGSILYSNREHLYTTDGKTTSVLTKIASTDISGFKQLNSTHVVLVAKSRYCLKMLNREDNRLRDMAGTCDSRGYADGKVGTGMLLQPQSVEIDIRNPGKLLVTDSSNNSLRSVDIDSGELGSLNVTGFNSPKGMMWLNNELLVTNDHYVSQVRWYNDGSITNFIITGSTSYGTNSVGYFSNTRYYYPQEFAKLKENLVIIADSYSRQLKLLDFNQRLVRPVCIEPVNSCGSYGSTMDSNLYSVLKVDDKLYVGMSNGIYLLSGSNLVEPCPDRNITAYIKPDEKSTEVKLHSGNTVGVLSVGSHEFKESYHSRLCSYYVNVFNDDNITNVCSHEDILAYLSPHQQTVEVELHGGAEAELPAGSFKFTERLCSYYVNVRRSSLLRRLVFKSDYDVTCDVLLDKVTSSFLQTVLNHKKDQLQRVCASDCKMSYNLKPWYECRDDRLTIYWPTETVYTADTNESPITLTEMLKKRMATTLLGYSEIVVLSHNPPLIPAKKNADGEATQLYLYTTCVDDTLSYDAAKDTCS